MKASRLAAAAMLATAITLPAALPSAASPSDRPEPPGLAKQDTLRWSTPKDFRIGTAVAGGGHHTSQPYPAPFFNDQQYREVLGSEFSSVSAENQMKWEFIHPERNRYRFAEMDAIVEFAQKHGQVVRGHTLLWHSQNPEWLEEGDFSDQELRTILKDHIMTVVGRYAGQIQQWDVANEIFDSEGNLRTEENIWIRELGPGIVADAFRWAHQADPEAKLFFNDYGVEANNAKSDAYYELIKDYLAKGVPVHGFAVQGHLSIRYGFPAGMEANLQRFDDLGLETAVTEIDVRMDLPNGAEPTAAQLEKQASYYQRALDACLGVEDCNSFTIWGFVDKYSWVPVFFEGQGAATVMWNDYTRKPAYYALQESLVKATPGGEHRWEHHPAYRH
ncbi:endo-1,4-beta-xylanase [Arthrobacter castelli]|uniref:endo-1,4-beta-xylanase n=1 Tax=Arthrobacter castelli TaxID=271431 RepID=UPI0004118114|nr:endo-1,4-beta-xylanase [Arthrobacter castelli]